jgi:hypothetical protein
MAPASDPQRPCREPLYDIDPATGVCIEIGSHAGDVRKVRCRLVLVATPTAAVHQMVRPAGRSL